MERERERGRGREKEGEREDYSFIPNYLSLLSPLPKHKIRNKREEKECRKENGRRTNNEGGSRKEGLTYLSITNLIVVQRPPLRVHWIQLTREMSRP